MLNGAARLNKNQRIKTTFTWIRLMAQPYLLAEYCWQPFWSSRHKQWQSGVNVPFSALATLGGWDKQLVLA